MIRTYTHMREQFLKAICYDKLWCITNITNHRYISKLQMWASAQRDGRASEYRWRPLFNAV